MGCGGIKLHQELKAERDELQRRIDAVMALGTEAITIGTWNTCLAMVKSLLAPKHDATAERAMSDKLSEKDVAEIRRKYLGWIKFVWTQPFRTAQRVAGWWRVCAENGHELAFTLSADLAAAITDMQPTVAKLLAERDAHLADLKEARERIEKLRAVMKEAGCTCGGLLSEHRRSCDIVIFANALADDALLERTK